MKGCQDKKFVEGILSLHIMLALHKHGALVFKEDLPKDAVAHLIKVLGKLDSEIPSIEDLRPSLSSKVLALIEEGIAHGYF